MPTTVEVHTRDDRQTVTIAAGTALSAAIDLGGKRLAFIQIPATWTTANLTFQVGNGESKDTGTFSDLYDKSGTEYTVTVGGASRTILVPLTDFIGYRFIKIRSGTTGTPVQQVTADRLLSIGLVA